jgi:dynein heavy chain
MFTLLLTLKIDMNSGKIRHEEFQTLIKGGASLDLNVVQPKPSKWITDSTWLNLVELSKLYQFSAILDQIPRNEKQWKQWFDKDAPEDEIIPDGYNNSLDIFRKLLLIRSWCPDRTLPQAKKYIADSIGEKFIEGVILDLERMFEESDSRTPLICFLSMGSDPTILIEQLAKRKFIDAKAISMGQGQEIHARRLVQTAMSSGGWVLLQNCHLSLDFCEEVLDTLTLTEELHENFRIWITTEPHLKFPIGLLQMSIKYTAEV